MACTDVAFAITQQLPAIDDEHPTEQQFVAPVWPTKDLDAPPSVHEVAADLVRRRSQRGRGRHRRDTPPAMSPRSARDLPPSQSPPWPRADRVPTRPSPFAAAGTDRPPPHERSDQPPLPSATSRQQPRRAPSHGIEPDVPSLTRHRQLP